eukprot:TRINITY_DN135067_c0_g1_i1.p5 TRINITY_DN135067_c0_g1~~TRINITY_DN135067_c0_g1_i1.p5  ORF type:complete len:207 (-),score=5.74 TRINITY_DN135067_c0_g1_i1:3195-3815(-)
MPDKGGFVYNMEHTATTSYDPDGITYESTYTTLRDDPGSQFQFDSRFYMYIYVKPFAPTETKQQLIFSKWAPGPLVHLELWIETTLPKGKLTVVTRDDTVTLSNYFDYDQYVRVGVSFLSGRYKVYKNETMISNTAGVNMDGLSSVRSFFFAIQQQEMYLGGNTISAAHDTYFRGKLKQLAIWNDHACFTYPLDSPVDQCLILYYY